MPQCLLRIVVYGHPPDCDDLELRRLVELETMPIVGADLRYLVSNHHDTPPLTVRRIMGSSDAEPVIVDLDDVRGDFHKIVSAMLLDGWQPHFEYRFDDEDKAIAFAEDHGDFLVRMDGGLFAISPGLLRCLDRASLRYERMPLRYERN